MTEIAGMWPYSHVSVHSYRHLGFRPQRDPLYFVLIPRVSGFGNGQVMDLEAKSGKFSCFPKSSKLWPLVQSEIVFPMIFYFFSIRH